jgi:hypothetical protein
LRLRFIVEVDADGMAGLADQGKESFLQHLKESDNRTLTNRFDSPYSQGASGKYLNIGTHKTQRYLFFNLVKFQHKRGIEMWLTVGDDCLSRAGY